MQNVTSERKPNTINLSAFCLLFALIWIQNTILPFVVRVMQAIPLIGAIAEQVVVAIFILLILLSLPRIFKSIRFGDVVFYLVACIVIFLTTAFFKDNAEFLQKDLWRILVLTIPMYFIGLSFKHEDIRKLLYIASVLSVFVMIAYQFYLRLAGRVTIDDDMNAAYNILPSVMYLSYIAFRKRRIMDWLVAILVVASMFVYGTRGPILAIAVYWCAEITVYVFKKGSAKLKIFYLTVIAILAFLVLNGSALSKIIELVSDVFARFGFSTRIFDLLLEGDILSDNGRNVLADRVIAAIRENPILGCGIMGDRVVAGDYAHNLFLEIWCQFGVVIGTVLLLTLIVIVIRALKNDHDGFVLMLVCMVFVKLMLSGSYLYEANLFFMLGIANSVFRKKLDGERKMHQKTPYVTEI